VKLAKNQERRTFFEPPMPDPTHISLLSPDRRVEVRFALADWYADPSTSLRGAGRCCPDAPLWQVWFAGRQMLRWSLVGGVSLQEQLAGTRTPGSCGQSLARSHACDERRVDHCRRQGTACGYPDDYSVAQPDDRVCGFEVAGVVRHRRRRTWQPESGDAASLVDHHNELVVRLRERAAPNRRVDLIFRCSNQGAAARVRVPRQRGLARVTPTGAGTVFRFPEETQGWIMAGGLRKVAVEEIAAVCDTPLTLNYAHGKLACLLQVGRSHTGRARPPDAPYAAAASGLAAALLPCGGSGGPALPDATAGSCFANKGLAALPDDAPVEVATPCESPWQVLLLGDKPCDLPNGSGFLLNLGGEIALRGSAPTADGMAGRVLPLLLPPGASVTPAHRLALELVCGAGAARWDETRFLRGEIGEFVVVARRLGAVWQVAGVTGADGRVLTVRLEEALGDRSDPPDQTDRRYALAIFRDPLPGEAAEDGVVRETFHGVDAFDKPCLELPPHGGFLLRLEPES
jgi:hypothetical protein